MVNLKSALIIATFLAVGIVISGCAGTPIISESVQFSAGAASSDASSPPHDAEAIGDRRSAGTSSNKTLSNVFDTLPMGPPKPKASLEPNVALKSYSSANVIRSTATARDRVTTHMGSGNTIEKLKDYAVVVAADKRINIPGPPGEMRVWIGTPHFRPATAEGMRSGETIIPALSDTAKITPFTPGIEVVPKESICEKIDPTGSEVRFQLKPLTKGTFRVGADVALYASNDCSGRPIPKTTSTVEVEVAVDVIAKIEQHGDEVAGETWKAFLAFWGKVVALLFALLLFLLRRHLYRWFGFKPKD